MTEVTVRADAELIKAAVRAAGIYDPGQPPARQALAVLRQLAAGDKRRTSATAFGGAAPKRAGRNWENLIVEHANAAGFDWDRAPLRGRRDLLDVTGCLPDGFLIGAKAIEVGVSPVEKMSGAMEQCHRAMENLARRGPAPDDVIPFQIMQRRGVAVGRAYAVTEYDWLLRLASLRRAAWLGSVTERRLAP